MILVHREVGQLSTIVSFSFNKQNSMKRHLFLLLTACVVLIGGCGGVDNSVTELPLSNETGYTAEQSENMKKTGSLVDPNEPPPSGKFLD